MQYFSSDSSYGITNRPISSFFFVMVAPFLEVSSSFSSPETSSKTNVVTSNSSTSPSRGDPSDPSSPGSNTVAASAWSLPRCVESIMDFYSSAEPAVSPAFSRTQCPPAGTHGPTPRREDKDVKLPKKRFATATASHEPVVTLPAVHDAEAFPYSGYDAIASVSAPANFDSWVPPTSSSAPSRRGSTTGRAVASSKKIQEESDDAVAIAVASAPPAPPSFFPVVASSPSRPAIDDDDEVDANKTNFSRFFNVQIMSYIFAGLILIFVMELFIQIGVHMTPPESRPLSALYYG